jgi:hypothetical protein
MSREELEDALLVADVLDGELPHWHRGQGDDEAPEERLQGPLGAEFERALEAAKCEGRGLPPGDDGGDLGATFG